MLLVWSERKLTVMLCHGRIKAWEITVKQFLLGFLFYLKWEVIWMNINWIKVFVAAFLEVFWVIGLTHSHDLWTWTGTVILIIVSNYLMISAAQVLPAGTVYAIFVGIGTGGTVVAEILFFGEPFRWGKIFLIAVLLSGVIGLKLVTENKSDKVKKGVES